MLSIFLARTPALQQPPSPVGVNWEGGYCHGIPLMCNLRFSNQRERTFLKNVSFAIFFVENRKNQNNCFIFTNGPHGTSPSCSERQDKNQNALGTGKKKIPDI